MNRKRISPKEMARLGWAKHARGSGYGSAAWRSSWVYRSLTGWELSHCGHPTALWPYLLVSPNGTVVLTGAGGPCREPKFGTAWPSVAEAIDFVGSLTVHEKVRYEQ
jgi:hypothetical protein